jgi:hypothetical protein
MPSSEVLRAVRLLKLHTYTQSVPGDGRVLATMLEAFLQAI